jgi:hypothetical protein
VLVANMPSVAMAVTNAMAQKPPRQDAEEGTFAIRVDGENHVVYQYDTGSPFRSTPDWRHVDEYNRSQAPAVNLTGAEFEEDSDGQTWVFARNVDPEREVEDTNQMGESDSDVIQQPLGKYVIEFGNGQQVAGNSQSDVMANAVDVMAKAYDLMDNIDIPYMSGYKNALINNRQKHPDGREMERGHQITGGYYVHTKSSAEQKIEYLEELADTCGAKINFVKGWN